MKTLLLDTVEWDLVKDAARNIAVASEPYSQAQDVASALRLFLGELWYNTSKGVPYWEQVLGHLPPLSLLRSKFTGAAVTVPGVVRARAFFSLFRGRKLRGQVQAFNTNGQVLTVTF